MRQFPIWNDVTSCIYKGSKSFGAKDTSETEILVGSARNNSYTLAKQVVTRRFKEHPVHGSVCVFKVSIDGIVLKEIVFTDNDGKAGDLLETNSFLSTSLTTQEAA